MSSTNRGGDRHASDYYITPRNEIERFLSAFLVDYEIDRPDRLTWFDPCAGGGVQITHSKRSGTMTTVNNPMAYPSVIEREFGAEVVTQDIRRDSAADHIGSYIDMPETSPPVLRSQTPVIDPDIIITNPPFSHATQIVEQALKDVDGQGFVIMLLRLNFMGAQSREPFFRDNMPESIYVHSRRMSFTPDNKTDSVEYAHFIWRPHLNPKSAALHHLSPLTQPLVSERILLPGMTS